MMTVVLAVRRSFEIVSAVVVVGGERIAVAVGEQNSAVGVEEQSSAVGVVLRELFS